jgi:hypothetical protein
LKGPVGMSDAKNLATYELTFPRDLDWETASRLFTAMAELYGATEPKGDYVPDRTGFPEGWDDHWEEEDWPADWDEHWEKKGQID